MAKSNKAQGEELRNLSEDALKDQIAEITFNYKKMKFGHSVNPIENPMAIRSTRRMLARLKTEQTKRASK